MGRNTFKICPSLVNLKNLVQARKKTDGIGPVKVITDTLRLENRDQFQRHPNVCSDISLVKLDITQNAHVFPTKIEKVFFLISYL